MPATPPATLLGLMWLASPALPVGGFSYSEGLEAAVEAGLVHDEASATAWLADQLELTLARSDGPLVAAACRAWTAHGDTGNTGAANRIAELNAWQRTTRESEELRRQGEQMGRSLLEWLKNGPHAADPRLAVLAGLATPDGSAPTWPVAFALAATLAGAAPREALLACAFGWAENMAQAAMKAVPLGQAAAQRMLQALAARIPEAAERALATGDDARQAFSPMLAILSARHETQYSRLFRS